MGIPSVAVWASFSGVRGSFAGHGFSDHPSPSVSLFSLEFTLSKRNEKVEDKTGKQRADLQKK